MPHNFSFSQTDAPPSYAECVGAAGLFFAEEEEEEEEDQEHDTFAPMYRYVDDNAYEREGCEPPAYQIFDPFPFPATTGSRVVALGNVRGQPV